MDALDGQPASWWLADQAEVLDELGRIDSDDGLRAVAKCLFERRSSATEALEIIRRHRRIEAFSRYITSAVEAHCERNPGTTALEIRLALESARDALVSLREPGNPGWHQYLKTLSQTPILPAPVLQPPKAQSGG